MKNLFMIVFILCVLFCPTELFTQNWLTREMQNVLTLQDQRDVSEKTLNSLLNNPDANIRFRIASACGSIQDLRLTETLLSHLNDSSDSVRMAIAFALAQTGGKSVVDKFVERLRSEKSVDVRERIFEALGKIVSVNDLDRILSLYASEKNSLDEQGMSMCIARCAIRNVVSKNCIDLLKNFSRSKNDLTGFYALYAISRFRKPELIDSLIPTIETSINDTSPDIRMFAASSAAFISDSTKSITLLLKGLKDKDWRVRVNSLRAIAASKFRLTRGVFEILFTLAKSNEPHIAITVLQALASKKSDLNLFSPMKLELLLTGDLMWVKESVIRSEAMITYAKIFPDQSANFLLQNISESKGMFREKCIEALGFVNQKNIVDALIRIPKKISDARTVMSVLLAMNEIKNRVDTTDRKLIIDFCLKCMRSDDIALITQSAEMCADSNFIAMNKAEIIQTAYTALSRLRDVTDVEPIVALCNLLGVCKDSSSLEPLKEKLRMPDRVISTAAAKALSKITGTDYSDKVTVPIPPVRTDYDWDFLSRINDRERVLIQTNRGTFFVQLDVQQAPFTVMNFLKLVDQKFYDGLSFHRVVPNFVIQGGDPRGDGWGGPGWTMRSEFGLNYFERGSIGIASSGKDTEGSQFFVTHCPTPHLDGRYTNFGKIVKGLSVVNRIQIEDKIIAIRRVY